MVNHDVCIVGGGIIGLAVARELRRRLGRSIRLCVLEKESRCCTHGSGRNSGVLHAGFYYTADTLRARLCRDGNRRLTEYCDAHNIPLRRCGKLVVAQNEHELAGLDELLRRAALNGVELHKITESEALEIEPRVQTFQSALWSPTTKSADVQQVAAALLSEVTQSGTIVLNDAPFVSATALPSSTGWNIQAGSHHFQCSHVINCAGLYADRVAQSFGFARDYTMLPFKGIYLYCNPQSVRLRTHIYPVPNLATPFLGVHTTLSVDGTSKIGPTAIPGFWREHYSGLSNFSAAECSDIMHQQARLAVSSLSSMLSRAVAQKKAARPRDFGEQFLSLAWEEIKKYRKANLVAGASKLVRGLTMSDVTQFGRPGIRAQLFNKRLGKLEMDFRIEGDSRSTHVINVISPGWTCSLPFADLICDTAERNWNAGQTMKL